jgi:hypothetical protein
MIYIGIDPGLGGAIAVLGEHGRVAVYDTPIATVKRKSKQKRKYAAAEMARILFEVTLQGTEIYAAIELVHAMAGQGVVSSFNFGHGLGLWEGMLAANKIPYELVMPQRWKGLLMHGMGKEKRRLAAARAAVVFPSSRSNCRRVQFSLRSIHGKGQR